MSTLYVPLHILYESLSLKLEGYLRGFHANEVAGVGVYLPIPTYLPKYLRLNSSTHVP